MDHLTKRGLSAQAPVDPETGERPPDELHATRFSIVPEWVLSEPGEVVKLYAVLDRYAGETRTLWPGQAALAERMGCSERHVRTLLSQLKAAGALVLVKRRYNGTTKYRLVRERPERPELEVLTDRNHSSGLSGTTVPPNESQLKRASEREPLSRANRGCDEPACPSFDAFWKTYPRKADKGAARKAWPKALKAAGGAEKILEGVERYAKDPNREAPFTKHPATWLSHECWDDEPLPPRQPKPSAAQPATVYVQHPQWEPEMSDEESAAVQERNWQEYERQQAQRQSGGQP